MQGYVFFAPPENIRVAKRQNIPYNAAIVKSHKKTLRQFACNLNFLTPSFMMDGKNPRYAVKTAKEADILSHLTRCNENFIPPLETKVRLPEYAKKLFLNSVTFEAWVDEVLAGLVAAYFNDTDHHVGYITSVSVIKDYAGMGIASELTQRCLDYGKQQGFKEIRLEVNTRNESAIRLYRKFGFIAHENNNRSVRMKLEIMKT